MTGLTADQLETRKTGIGASEVAALVGLSSWMNPCLLYRMKVEGHVREDTEWLERGRMLEEAALKWYAHREKATLTFPGTLRHPTRPVLLATPDALASNGQVLVEAKTVGQLALHKRGKPGTDEIPEAYLCQVHYAMGVAGMREAHVPALFVGERLEVFRVTFDEQLFEQLAQAAEAFWREHIEPRKPPKGYRKLRKKEQANGSSGDTVDAGAGGPHQANGGPPGHLG